MNFNFGDNNNTDGKQPFDVDQSKKDNVTQEFSFDGKHGLGDENKESFSQMMKQYQQQQQQQKVDWGGLVKLREILVKDPEDVDWNFGPMLEDLPEKPCFTKKQEDRIREILKETIESMLHDKSTELGKMLNAPKDE